MAAKGGKVMGREVSDGIPSVQLVFHVDLLSMRSFIAVSFTVHVHIDGLTHLSCLQ